MSPVSLPTKQLILLCVLAPLMFTGCQQKMADQPSFDDYQSCELFEDGSTARQLPEGTIPRGHLRIDNALFRGRVAVESDTGQGVNAIDRPEITGAKAVLAAEAAKFEGVVTEFPIPITREVIEHGRNRYLIYCVVCHDPLGDGDGKIVERGYTKPPSYHIERLREAPVGHFFRVISEGYGAMPSYAAQIPVRDRWAIVAYVRALQLSQHFPEDELTDTLRQHWAEQTQREQGD